MLYINFAIKINSICVQFFVLFLNVNKPPRRKVALSFWSCGDDAREEVGENEEDCPRRFPLTLAGYVDEILR